MTTTLRNFVSFFTDNARRLVLAGLLAGLLAVGGVIAWRFGPRFGGGTSPSPLLQRTTEVRTHARLLELDLELAALAERLGSDRSEARLLQTVVRLERRLDALRVPGSDDLLPAFERLRTQIDGDPSGAHEIVAQLRHDLLALRPSATP